MKPLHYMTLHCIASHHITNVEATRKDNSAESAPRGRKEKGKGQSKGEEEREKDGREVR